MIFLSPYSCQNSRVNFYHDKEVIYFRDNIKSKINFHKSFTAEIIVCA